MYPSSKEFNSMVSRSRDLKLTLSNYEQWKLNFLEQAMSFGEAGRCLRNKVPFDPREPQDSDLKNRATGSVISEDEWNTMLQIQLEDAFDDEDAQEEIRSVFSAQYKPAYPAGIQFDEAYKRYIRLSDYHRSDAPRLLAAMLDSFSHSAKEKIRANSRYKAAESTIDYLDMWKITEEVMARQGRYSSITARTRHMDLHQGESSFDAYVLLFRNSVQALSDLGVVMDNVTNVLQFLTRLKPMGGTWDDKVATLIATDPVPDLDEVVSALQAHKQLTDVIKASRGETTQKPKPSIAGPDSKVLAADSDKATDPRRKPGIIRCWNCNREGHGTNKCESPKATCTTCNKPGHCTAAHAAWKSITDKRRATEKTTQVKSVRFELGGAEVDLDLWLFLRKQFCTVWPFLRQYVQYFVVVLNVLNTNRDT